VPRVLSIIIPTLNRCSYLCEALQSIIKSQCDFEKIQVCISNNFSDENYDPLLELIKAAPASLDIVYLSQPARLPIDESMYAAYALSTAEYVYFLGDDDYFLDGELDKLLTLISASNVEVAVFNGFIVDAENRIMGKHFELGPATYTSVAEAFGALRDKGMFGAVLVKRELLDEKYFMALFGTSHAYGCFWLSLLNRASPDCRVLIPDFPLVALRMAKKSYNHMLVYYRDIPYEISLYNRLLSKPASQDLNRAFEDDFVRKVTGLRFLCYIKGMGMDLAEIRNINSELFVKAGINIMIASFIVDSGLYSALKNTKRAISSLRGT
jgi:abequosyltransferase